MLGPSAGCPGAPSSRDAVRTFAAASYASSVWLTATTASVLPPSAHGCDTVLISVGEYGDLTR